MRKDPDETLDRILDPDRRGELYPLYRELRESFPIFKSSHPAIAGSWVLTRYADIDLVLRRFPFNTPEADAAQIYNLGDGGPFYETMRTMMQNLEFSDHQRLRRLVSPAFTPRTLERMKDLVQGILDDMLGELAPAGRMDLIADFAHRFPARVILDMMAIPDKDHARLAGYADDFIRRLDIGLSLSSEVIERGDIAAQGLREYFTELLDIRRKEPGDDLVSTLISATDGADALIPEEIVSTAIVIFEGGHQTTSNVFGTSMIALFDNDRALAQFRDDRTITRSACEELLRFDPPVQANQRVLTEAVTIDGNMLPAGEKVFAFLGAANRDPAQFPEPDALRLDRDNARSHLSFGTGVHHCLGAHLARLNFSAGLRTLFDRLPGLRPAYDEPDWEPTLINWGPTSLPVEWEPGSS